MPITHNPSSGIPIHHYDNAERERNRKAKLINKDRPLNRHERRKIERKLSKKINKLDISGGGYDNGF